MKEINKNTLKSKKILKYLINEYFLDLKNTDKKIAYVSSMAPVEILQAFGFKLYFPENHAAIIGARRLEYNYLTKTTQKTGFNENCCSYMLSDIGSNILENSPLKEYNLPPKPDLIVYNTNQCLEIKHWLTYYADKYNIPIFGIETPHIISKKDPLITEYITKQIEKLITNIETTFKTKLDRDKLQETVLHSSTCSLLWQEILEYSKLTPSPISFFDHCNFMAPAVLLRGNKNAVEFYNILLKELCELKENNYSAVKEERNRIIWAGMPIWGALKYMSNMFDNLDTCLVNSIYGSSWVFNLDKNQPVQSMAKAYTQLFINLTEKEKLEYLVNLTKNWSAQGIIFHHSLSCKRNSDNYYGLSKQLKECYEIPSITFEADHNNLKAFNQKRFTTLVEALIEQIHSRKK